MPLLVLGLIVPMLAAGCGDGGDASDPDAPLIQVLYVDERHGWPATGGELVETEVIADGTERYRQTVEYSYEEGEVEETFVTIRDGNRALQINHDAAVPYRVVEAADEQPPEDLSTIGWDTESERFRKECSEPDELGTRMILGRDAVGYRCTFDYIGARSEREEVWLDQATGVILEAGGFKAEEVNVSPPIDADTFSTTPPPGASAEVVKATGTPHP
jgi:hypothetical protein